MLNSFLSLADTASSNASNIVCTLSYRDAIIGLINHVFKDGHWDPFTCLARLLMVRFFSYFGSLWEVCNMVPTAAMQTFIRDPTVL